MIDYTNDIINEFFASHVSELAIPESFAVPTDGQKRLLMFVLIFASYIRAIGSAGEAKVVRKVTKHMLLAGLQ